MSTTDQLKQRLAEWHALLQTQSAVTLDERFSLVSLLKDCRTALEQQEQALKEAAELIAEDGLSPGLRPNPNQVCGPQQPPKRKEPMIRK